MSSEFFKAVKDGDMAKVHQMIRREPSLANAKSPDGSSAVITATHYGNKNIAELLVSNMAR